MRLLARLLRLVQRSINVWLAQRVTTETYFYTVEPVNSAAVDTKTCVLRANLSALMLMADSRAMVVVPSHRVHRLPDSIDFEAGCID